MAAVAAVTFVAWPVCGVLFVAPAVLVEPVEPSAGTPGVGSWTLLPRPGGTVTPVVEPVVVPVVEPGTPGTPGRPAVAPKSPTALAQVAFTAATGCALSAAPRTALTHAPVACGVTMELPADVFVCPVVPSVTDEEEPVLGGCLGACCCAVGRVPCGIELPPMLAEPSAEVAVDDVLGLVAPAMPPLALLALLALPLPLVGPCVELRRAFVVPAVVFAGTPVPICEPVVEPADVAALGAIGDLDVLDVLDGLGAWGGACMCIDCVGALTCASTVCVTCATSASAAFTCAPAGEPVPSCRFAGTLDAAGARSRLRCDAAELVSWLPPRVREW